jgi:hypothetical protein
MREAGRSSIPFELLQFPCAPGLELFTHDVGMPVGRDNDMQMIRPAVHCMQSPTANLAVLADRRFNERPLLGIEAAS